jgi:hypothetical protein
MVGVFAFTVAKKRTATFLGGAAGQLVASGDACVDLHKECRGWAASGECKKNAGFMVGDRGQCRASCKACPYPTDVV